MKKTFVIGAVLFLLTASVASANHAWSKYHWDLSTADTELSPLGFGDNLTTAEWDASLSLASFDWNKSVLKNAIVSGAGNADCAPVKGRVEVCNDEYGENGWLGIASIWATRGKESHITQGAVKLNDTYFNQAPYNTSAWRNLVMCQEVGHTFGLGHQDEDFYNTNLGTCMDYTNDPESNQHPNQHDYDMLTEIYAHLNGTSGGGSDGGGKGNGKGKPSGVGANINVNDPSAWGEAIAYDAQGRASLYKRALGNGQILFTHVFWIIEE